MLENDFQGLINSNETNMGKYLFHGVVAILRYQYYDFEMAYYLDDMCSILRWIAAWLDNMLIKTWQQ